MSFITPQSIEEIFGVDKPIIGMIHLGPLPGSALYEGDMEAIVKRAIEDAIALEAGGVDAVEIENMGDMTYFPGKVGPETVAAMTYVATKVSERIKLPIGICVLTDPVAALAIAHAVKAKFIRATIYTDAVVDVSGILNACAHDVQRLKKLIMDKNTKIFADVYVKHSAPLASKPIEYAAKDAVYFLADAVVISGQFTGEEAPFDIIKKVKAADPHISVLVGSGLREENVERLLAVADGAIVGTAFKKDAKTFNPVDKARVQRFMEKVKSLRRKTS